MSAWTSDELNQFDDTDKDVTFVDVATDDPINADLDEAYGSKYRRYSGPVASITSSMARATTLKLVAK
jgi:hypothetical protein